MIKVVLWDVDGTLLDFHAAEQAAIKSLFREFGLGECTDHMLADYSGINLGYWKAMERGEISKDELLYRRFEDFFSKYGLDTSCTKAFNDRYQYALGDTIVFFDGAMETVKALRRHGVLQCAVTNGTKVAQDRKLKSSGLGELFDYIFISEEVGIEKPNIGFFNAIWETIGRYAPNEVLIVGDSLTSDIRGGINAGIKTCWFNPGNAANNLDKAANNSGLKPDYEIHRLEEVMEIITFSPAR